MPQPPTRESELRVTFRFGRLLSTAALALLGCDPCALNLTAAMAAADARTFAACGRHADPSSVRLVRGYVQCGAEAKAVGCTWFRDRRVVLSRLTRSQFELEQVATHEYLHLLGAEHVPAGHGIMADSRSAALNRVTAEDLAKAVCPRPRAE